MMPAPVPAAVYARPEFDTTPSWPLNSHLELGALDSAVPCARMHAKQVVIEWGLAALADNVELLVSELMTNAIRGSDGLMSPAVRLWLVSDHDCVMIHVWDASNEMPVRREADLDSERGRGLLLVETLSRDWGTYRTADGKVVWVTV
jgi:anti-sigma regulatory factor (Ser/Thr protein kinase)